MLHILNGDSLASKFPPDIHGQRAVVRECLLDGPVEAQSLEELWVIRDEYLTSHYGSKEKGYFEKVVPEFETILTARSDEKVYCWFEKDLFCQVNLWFVMNLLRKHQGEVYLIIPEKADLRLGFAELNERQLHEHFRDARLLTKNERSILGNLWTLYQLQHIDEAMTLAKQDHYELPFLLEAVQAWKDAIPHGTYPGKPKATLLEILDELKTDDFKKIFLEFIKRAPIYGFGDLQIKRLLEEIKKEAV
ncbi:DUF1835 domain-containing protein [Algoriphagus lutimaris]|uniref:DUF1835 domain-containing protein n=1 Tax=Algoriphagus lutimaris TaxID=613197 RepID=UPI00196B374B|nr:DUF1835 domain-containing protein [Algoriphagus lutimaris]MBN3518464.1 DUF1835 domain-containing protein [Algoriphagus lutimaris]